MSESNDEQFDAMLSGFFKEALDGQQGRCERHFRRHLSDTGRALWRQRTWVLGAFITGMAASVAVIWASPLFRAGQPAIGGSPVQQIAESHALPDPIPAVERVVQSHTTDEGIMLFDNDTPMRVLRRQGLQQTRWLNGAQDVRAEQATPEDELVFIKLPTY